MVSNKVSPVPLYVQIKEDILAQIRSGQLSPDSVVPSEWELAQKYDVSRMTSRAALTELTQEGYLYRVQGKGTFVARPKIEQRLTCLTGFTEDMRNRRMRPGSQVLRLELAPTPMLAAKVLQVAPGQPVVLLERLRMAEGEPMALETCYLHFDRAQELLGEDFEDSSLYGFLTEKYDVIPTRAEQQMEAGLCSQRERELLGLEEGSPVLKNRRITFDQRGRPFEYTESVYRGDRYVFHAELTSL